MKILFKCSMQGHINPTLPLVKDLVKNGHIVDYYCSESSKKKIEFIGANFKDYKIAFDDIDPTKKIPDDKWCFEICEVFKINC